MFLLVLQKRVGLTERPLLSRLPVRTSPLYMSGEEAITHSETIERRTGGQKGIPRAGVQGGSFG